jgi:hypothetical protein
MGGLVLFTGYFAIEERNPYLRIVFCCGKVIVAKPNSGVL